MEKPKSSLSWLSKFLTVWIFSAMILGIAIGYAFPQTSSAIGTLSIGTTSIPIAIGLIWMMYPPLARVGYEEIRKVVRVKGSKTMLAENIVLTWVISFRIGLKGSVCDGNWTFNRSADHDKFSECCSLV
jgi:ACR3 family arsenite transporter